MTRCSLYSSFCIPLFQIIITILLFPKKISRPFIFTTSMQTTMFLCSYSGFTLCTDLFILPKVKLTWSTSHLYEQIKYIFLRFGLILYQLFYYALILTLLTKLKCRICACTLFSILKTLFRN